MHMNLAYLLQLGYSIRNHVLRHFPRFSLRVLSMLSHLRHLLPTDLRRELEANLRLAFPGKDSEEITRLARSTLVANLVDGAAQLRLELLPKRTLFRETLAVRIIGMENLQRASADGKPVILVTPHYGCFMQAALRVAFEQQTKQIYFFYNPADRNPYAETSDALIGLIDDRCIKIHYDRKGVITALRALKKGATLCIMPDQITPEGEIVYVPFFGRFFGVMQGVAFFALKANAQIIPVYCYASASGAQVLEYHAPLAVDADPGLSEQARIYLITVALFSEIERQLLKAPAHWRYWNQFERRSLDSPVLPKSHADMAAQLDQVLKRVSSVPSAVDVIREWQTLLRDLGATTGSQTHF